MMELATDVKHKKLCEAKETESAARGVAPSQLSIEKVSSGSSTTLC